MSDLWRRRAERLAAAIPRSRLHHAASAWAERRPARERWGVAFSGGADSLCLLLLVWAHWPKRRRALRALHFDHRLRGAASRADAMFCRTVARGLGIACAQGAWRRRAGSPASEAAARAARFAFFDAATRRNRIGVLWLGHHRDDIAESMLMRLARGSGAAGLAAPRPVHRGPAGRIHVRPLLDLDKAEIISALRRAGVPWREDATNANGDYFRNRLRRSVVPAWKRAAEGRDALAGAARSRLMLEEDDSALEAWVDRARLIVRGRLDVGEVGTLPAAVGRRALHRWLLVHGCEGCLSSRGFDALLDAVRSGGASRHSLGPNAFAVVRGGWLCREASRRRSRAASR